MTFIHYRNLCLYAATRRWPSLRSPIFLANT